jgi:hypothetical protein
LLKKKQKLSLIKNFSKTFTSLDNSKTRGEKNLFALWMNKQLEWTRVPKNTIGNFITEFLPKYVLD